MEAAALVATVVGQDLVTGDDGVFRIARKVAKDRMISTVDPEARHGHKTVHRGFDGYKGHTSVDPDSELITAATVTPGNAGDASVAEELLGELVDQTAPEREAEPEGPVGAAYGDSAYGTGELLDKLEEARIDPVVKVQAPTNSGGRFAKDRFAIDLEQNTVTCPNEARVLIAWGKNGGMARFGAACATCPLVASCTDSANGRTIFVGNYEAQLARARARQAEPERAADYRATRPKVERKLGHLMRRRHGGRRARVRGTAKVAADFNLLVGAINLARLAVLDLRWSGTAWVAATP